MLSNSGLRRKVKEIKALILSHQDLHPIETVEMWEHRGGEVIKISSEDFWRIKDTEPDRLSTIQVKVIREYRDPGDLAAANRRARKGSWADEYAAKLRQRNDRFGSEYIRALRGEESSPRIPKTNTMFTPKHPEGLTTVTVKGELEEAPQAPEPPQPAPAPAPQEIAPQQPVQEAVAPQEQQAQPTRPEQPLSWLYDDSLLADI